MTDCINQPEERNEDSIMDVEKAAEYLGVSPSTVVRAVRRGHLKPVVPPNPARLRQPRYDFHHSELDRYKLAPKIRKPRQS
jgi:predicted site-specific integrase-resolvase